MHEAIMKVSELSTSLLHTISQGRDILYMVDRGVKKSPDMTLNKTAVSFFLVRFKVLSLHRLSSIEIHYASNIVKSYLQTFNTKVHVRL